jgi:hypothetical protein
VLGDFKKDEYFKIDVESHIYPPVLEMDYFTRRHKSRYTLFERLGVSALPEYQEMSERMRGVWSSEPEVVIELMDMYGIDMACVMRENMMMITSWAYPMATNRYVFSACEKYPERFIFQANVGPVLRRGVKNAIWELEYLVKEKNCRLIKMYLPEEETYPNDPQLYPFYEKICELDIPMTVHTGMSWGQLLGPSKYCRPIYLDDVATEFPELKIIGFHAGWPYCREMNMVASNHINMYISLSLLVPWGITMPWRFAEILGEAIQSVGVDRVIWGTDYFGPFCELAMRLSVEGLSDFEMPDELRGRYGLPPLTDEDKAKIFGLNLAKLLGVEAKRRTP